MRKIAVIPAYECDETGMVLGYSFADRRGRVRLRKPARPIGKHFRRPAA